MPWCIPHKKEIYIYMYMYISVCVLDLENVETVKQPVTTTKYTSYNPADYALFLEPYAQHIKGENGMYMEYYCASTPPVQCNCRTGSEAAN